MKRKITLISAVLLCLTLLVPAAQTADTRPEPPEWVDESEYLVFVNGSAYEGET